MKPREGRERSLHGLAEAHLVCEDAVEPVLVEGDEPLDPVHLERGCVELEDQLHSPVWTAPREREKVAAELEAT